MLDILLHILDEDLAEDALQKENKISIQQQLIAAGFAPYEIQQALKWLKELKVLCEQPNPIGKNSGVRIWSTIEQRKISQEAQILIMQLERQDLIDAWQREIIIDRALALNIQLVDDEQIKWIMLMVSYYIRLEEHPMEWVEHILMQEPSCHH